MAKSNKSITFEASQELVLPADTSQSLAIRTRDWKSLRQKAEGLSSLASKWELGFSVSVSVFVSFLLAALAPDTSSLNSVFWLVTAFSAGLSLVAFIGMKSEKKNFESDQKDLLSSMDDIESQYPDQFLSDIKYREDVLDASPSLRTSIPELQEDELYESAKKLALERGRISTSMIQRYMRIGYARAARIIQRMEDEGFVSPPDGARPRTILQGKTSHTQSI